MSAHHARRGMLAAAVALGLMTLSTPARADTVTQWNALATGALVGEGQGASALVGLAMMHTAMFDAVTAIDRRYEPYLAEPRAKRWYSQDAAAATAAYHVLVDSKPSFVLPQNQAALALSAQQAYDAALAAIPAGPAKDGGIAVGNAAAAAMVAARTGDGRYGTPGFDLLLPGAGVWRPVLPAFVNDPFAWTRDVKPFLIENGTQFGGPGPYALTSRRYAREFDEVKTLGALNSAVRTPDQTDAARFWGATNSVGTWGLLFRDIADGQQLSLPDDARLFARLYLAGADGAITVWNDKAKYMFWRPITAIREAATDGNPQTVPDTGWLPLVNTPPYPDWPSGLSALGGAAAETLQDFFGTDDVSFAATNTAIPPVHRAYASFSQAAEDIINARVWAGIHFRHSDEVGADIGERVARFESRRFPQEADHHDGHHHGDYRYGADDDDD